MVGPPGPCVCGCALTADTSYGFAVIRFAADVLGTPLDPWQELAVIHGGELLDDGRPRFRTVLVLVARQNGKTHLLTVLALFWLFIEKWPLTLGMSTMLEYARESWDNARVIAEDVDELRQHLPRNAVKEGNNDVRLLTSHGSRYKIAAANRRGGRSLRIDRLIIDELREHATWVAWNAATNAMNARPYGQAWCITNMGDDTSVVLNSLRQAAVDFIETGEGDQRLGLLEWSAPQGCAVDDRAAIAQANPNVGRRQHWDDLLGPAARAKRAGGEEEAGYRAEVLCQRVPRLNPAIDLDAWRACAVPGGLDDVRDRVAMVLDLAPDLRHAVLYAAAVVDGGRVRLDFVKQWEGQGCTAAVRRELPGVLAATAPAAFGWLPDGPAAALSADLAAGKDRPSSVSVPAAVVVEAIRGETAAVCMGFADLVDAGQVLHSDDPLLTAQVEAAEWLTRGNTRVFSRRGGRVNALYAAAGAAHLARMLPEPEPEYDPLANIH